MGPRDTKYDPNSIPSLPNYNSSPNRNQTVHIFDTYPTNSTLVNMHATLKLSMLEPPCTGLESSPFAAHIEQPDEADPVALRTFGQNTTTVALLSITPPSTTLPISFVLVCT